MTSRNGMAIGIAAALAAFAFTFSEVGSAKSLTLAEAKAIAVKNNYEVQANLKRAESMREKVAQGRSAFYPTIGVAGGYEFEGREDQERQAVVGYAYIRYNIFNGFADRYAVREQQLAVENAELATEKVAFEIGLDVESFYHEYLRHQTHIELMQEAISRNQSLIKVVNRTRQQGLVSAADVLSFQMTAAELKSGLHSLENAREETKVGLLRIMGSMDPSGIQPSGKLSHQHLDRSLMDYLQQIREKSFPVRLAAFAAETKEHQWRQVRSSWLPKVDFEIRSGYLALNELATDEEVGTNVGVLATWDLFSGLKTRSVESEKKFRLEESELLLKQEILNVISQAEIRYRRLKTIESRVDLESGNIKLSENYYDTIRQEYARGYKSSADLADAAATVFDVRRRQIDYLWDFLKERIELERLTGVPVETVSVPVDHTHP